MYDYVSWNVFFLYLYDGLYLYWITNNMYVFLKFRF